MLYRINLNIHEHGHTYLTTCCVEPASESGLVVTCDRLMLVVLCIVDLVVDLVL